MPRLEELGEESCPLIDPIPGRLVGVERFPSGKLKLTVDVNNGGGQLTREVDVLVLATSLTPNYEGLYPKLIGGSEFDGSTESVPGLRLQSSSPYAVIPCKRLRGREVPHNNQQQHSNDIGIPLSSHHIMQFPQQLHTGMCTVKRIPPQRRRTTRYSPPGRTATSQPLRNLCTGVLYRPGRWQLLQGLGPCFPARSSGESTY